MTLKKHSIALAIAGLCLSINGIAAETRSTHSSDLSIKSGSVSVHPVKLSQSKHHLSSLDLEKIATAYVHQHQAQKALPLQGTLHLVNVKSSLLAEHFHFQQFIHGVPVWQSELIVSLSTTSGEVLKTYDRTVHAREGLPANADSVVSAKQALVKSWHALGAKGELSAVPLAERAYLLHGQRYKQAFRTELNFSAIKGSWEQIVDAQTGELLRQFRRDLPNKSPTGELIGSGSKPRYIAKQSNQALIKAADSFEQALSRLKQHQSASASTLWRALADGSGLVFDPDPKTTLNNDNLLNTSDPSEFDPAYQTVTLRDVTLDAGLYSLTGPYVDIIDFDPPSTRPSTTNDGLWTEKRGNNSFNDAMVYYQIDQNQRYIQSLGFTGSSSIQNTPIEADTDGQNGADNSSFNPSTNRLSFGHGGVPDTEDADVILHEYGHAINFGINANFVGGDTAAMGEGFGDYWAGSYSYSTANGQTFFPERVFHWDGHNTFWSGRVMNSTSHRYDPNINYAAHEPVDGIANYGDELWSTPLFQSLIELMNDGETRTSVDQVVLEGQFGLGSGLKMPDMALSIVTMGKTLFPSDPHGAVFYKWFRQMNILPQPLSDQAITFESAGTNNAADPGETVEFKIPLKNGSIFDIANLQTTLTSGTTGITLAQASSGYPDIASGETRPNTDNFRISIPGSFQCGSAINLTLGSDYQLNGDNSQDFDFRMFTGARTKLSETVSPNLAIPDNDAVTGVSSNVTIANAGTQVDNNFSIDLDITHSYVGDLIIRLTSPTGTSVVLFQVDEDDDAQNLVFNIPDDRPSLESLSAFDGEDLNGEWTLTVTDNAADDQGTLNSWSMNVSSPAVCEQPGNNDDDDDNKDILYLLVGIILIGMEAGSLHMAWLLIALLWLRKRNLTVNNSY